MNHEHKTEKAEEQSETCQECSQDFNLRVCTTCGHVGCCDSSQKHARKHFEETGHEVIRAKPQEEGFIWCYVCDEYID